ncbi:MAG: carbohydrate kinase [Azospirillaceae bacterium]
MIVSCGEALIDFVPMAGGAGESGYRPLVGGSPLNVAVAVARLDRSAGFLARLSTDLFGDMIVDHMAANGVDTRHVRRADQPTTLAFVSLAEGEEPQYAFFAENSADRNLAPGDIAADLGDDVTCLHFGSFSLAIEPSGSTLGGLMASEHGRRVIALDPNIRPTLIPDKAAFTRRLEGWLPLVDIVKVSRADLDWLYPGEDWRAIAARWREAGPALVVVTLGADGAHALGGFGETAVAGRPVEVVDTVGAGDTFHAGLLAALDEAGLLTPARLHETTAEAAAAALDWGVRASALTCARAGADPPERAAVAALSD